MKEDEETFNQYQYDIGWRALFRALPLADEADRHYFCCYIDGRRAMDSRPRWEGFDRRISAGCQG